VNLFKRLKQAIGTILGSDIRHLYSNYVSEAMCDIMSAHLKFNSNILLGVQVIIGGFWIDNQVCWALTQLVTSLYRSLSFTD
jgi:hypothetical protein